MTSPPPDQDIVRLFAQTYLNDRRQDRRWRWVWRWVMAALFAWLVISLYRSAPTTAAGTTHTALIEIQGEIANEAVANAQDISEALRAAFEEDTAQAIVLRINSPGGSPVQAGLINDEIHRLKALHKKPVYAVCEEMCASAAYYIAVAADKIYVDKASIVGSIGVLMDGFGFTGVMEKVGVERRLLTAGANKGFLDPFSPMKDKHKAYVEQTLAQIHQQFIDTVKKGRGQRLKEDADTFSGLFWNGQEATRLGLVDALGSTDQVARDIVKAEELIDYTTYPDWTERLTDRLGAAIGQSVFQTSLKNTIPPLR